jgi:hypothetical protein
MAISIDWDTKVINIPQSFLTPAAAADSYYLDTNEFRIALRDIEDDEEGVVFPKTHNHNTKVTLSGIEYARIIEIINGYTVTFENTGSPYRVFLLGSNNNILDVTNLNNVSVAPSNSAGLVQMQEIEFNEYANGLYLDVVNGSAGTLHPTGTLRKPVSNLTDAMTIASARGVGTINVIGDATIDSGGDYRDITFVGESHAKTTLTISAAAQVDRCEFYSAMVGGTLDQDALLSNCMIENLTYVNGEIKDCILKPPGVIELGGTDHATLVRCVTECTEGGPPVTIDMGGAGQPLAIRDLSGAVKLTNKTGPEDSSAVMSGGAVYLDLANMTGGRIKIAGVCDVYDWDTKENLDSGTYGGLTVVNKAISNHAVWDAQIETGYSAAEMMKLMAAALAGELSGAGGETITIRDLNDTIDRITATVDSLGNRTTVVHDVS